MQACALISMQVGHQWPASRQISLTLPPAAGTSTSPEPALLLFPLASVSILSIFMARAPLAP